MFTILLSTMMVYAQNQNSKEVKTLQAFLNQPSADGVTNAQALGADVSNPVTWHGVTWEGGHVSAIEWKGKKLAGVLDLSSFTGLKKLDVSKNELTGLSVQGCTALAELNASHNRLTQFNVNGCTVLAKLNIYKNRLLEIELSGTPMLTQVNCSNNLFVDLNVSNAMNLETLNCQGNHLERLEVDALNSNIFMQVITSLHQ